MRSKQVHAYAGALRAQEVTPLKAPPKEISSSSSYKVTSVIINECKTKTVMELRTIENDNVFFSSPQDNVMSGYPLKYVKWVAEQLNCKKSDLRLLAVHPDFEEHDEEGWRIESFFPAKTEINREVIHSDGVKETLHLEMFALVAFIKLYTGKGFEFIKNMCAFIDYNNGIIKSTHEELLGEIKHNIQVNLKVNPDNFPELINIYNSCFSKNIFLYDINDGNFKWCS